MLLLTSLYLVMPVGRLIWHHAPVGGVTAVALILLPGAQVIAGYEQFGMHNDGHGLRA